LSMIHIAFLGWKCTILTKPPWLNQTVSIPTTLDCIRQWQQKFRIQSRFIDLYSSQVKIMTKRSKRLNVSIQIECESEYLYI
jgi:hypothetical protein